MQLLNREIFLLDEITSALNSELKNFIVQYFMKMQQTIIVVSHDEIWHKQAIRKVEW
jgi:putative ABC transport system ATP-binding protein